MRKLAVLLSTACLAILTACGGVQTSDNPGPGPGPAPTPTATPPQGTGQLSQIKHIIWMLQENRSFDNYFGKLNDYRVAQGLPADVDGLPPNASNPAWDNSGTINAYHLNTVCIENISPSWDPSRRSINRNNPNSTSGPLDGFVYSAARFAQDETTKGRPYSDLAGIRAMGYYTERELPYYYFMSTQFAISDRWFSPILSRTPPNRIANFAASALGVVSTPPTGTQFSQKTIFHLLQEKGISWKIYTTTANTYLGYWGGFINQHRSKIVPVAQYFTDLTNGTLPEVAFIETGVEKTEGGGTSTGDEHPGANVQIGAKYVSGLINALMKSSSWKESVFILTYDEGGNTYDHVLPQPAPIPDAIPPMLIPGNHPDEFDTTGFRVPVLVVSPFAKKGYVSHTTMDFTAILKLIETRFGLPNLTARDAAQPDMTEFFDLTNPPSMTPPTPPEQPTNGPCRPATLP